MCPESNSIISLKIKEIKINSSLASDVLDTTITPELREEGILRNLIRRVQEWRKEQKLTIADRPVFEMVASEEEKIVAEKYKKEIIEEAGLAELVVTRDLFL